MGPPQNVGEVTGMDSVAKELTKIFHGDGDRQWCYLIQSVSRAYSLDADVQSLTPGDGDVAHSTDLRLLHCLPWRQHKRPLPNLHSAALGCTSLPQACASPVSDSRLPYIAYVLIEYLHLYSTGYIVLIIIT